MLINFDRLTEPTPQEVEVQRLLLASEDAVAGANPLDRVACAIIKVYRDYLDARIRNTTDELESKNLKLYACSNDIRRARTDCLRLVGGMRSRASI